MSDKKRSIAEIQQDYQSACLKAGHLQYQVFVYSKDLEMVNEQLREFNLEAAAVKAEEEKAKQEAPAEQKE